MKKVIQLRTKEDFLLYSNIKTLVTDATTIAGNSCAYNTTYEAFRVNDSLSTQKGAIEVLLGVLCLGDTVNITAEIYNISGERAKLALDVITPSTSTVGVVKSEKTGMFEVISAKFVCNKINQEYKAVLGSFTGDISDYYIRNIKIEINTSKSNLIKPYKESIRLYNIKVLSGSFVVSTAHTKDTCTMVIDTTFLGVPALKITHDVPFSSTMAGMSQVSLSAINDFKYDARTRGETPNSLYVLFYDKTTSAIVNPSVILGLTTFWFNVVHYGYEN